MLLFLCLMPRVVGSVSSIVSVEIAFLARPTINVCLDISITLLHWEDVAYILKFLYSTIYSSHSAGLEPGGQ